MVGYNGPIYMTVPTKAIAPILLEDMRKVAVEKKGRYHTKASPDAQILLHVCLLHIYCEKENQ